MAYKVIVKKRFINKVKKTLNYLEINWSTKIAEQFLLKIDRHLELLSKHPNAGAPSAKVKDVRGLALTRHNKIYYKVQEGEIIILNMYDTRMNPKNRSY